MNAPTAPSNSGFGILGMGMYLPDRVVDNAEIAERSGVTPDWIVARTGVEQRRRAADGELTADLGAEAVRRAIKDAERRTEGPVPTPDLLVFATTTPDRQVPAPVYDVHGRVGLPAIPALSVDGACAGFAQSIIIGYAWHRAGLADAVLVAAASRTANYVDRTDRSIAPLFGDGAGAFLLGPVPQGYGILAFDMLTDSSGADLLHTPLHGTGRTDQQYLRMDGRALVQAIATELPRMLTGALDRAGLTTADIDRLVMHQGNVRMVEAFGAAIGLPPDRVPTSGRRVANTVSASLPIGAVVTDEDRPLRRGDIVALLTAGAGVSGAVLILRWY